MKVAIITPYNYPTMRGNAVTVRRIGKYLAWKGCEAKIFSLENEFAEDISASIREFAPDLIHAFHAFTGGRVARLSAHQTGVPYIVTMTGTDAYEALEDRRKSETHLVLHDAAAVTVFHQSIKRKVTGHFTTLAEKISIIPQGVEVVDGGLSDHCTPLPEGKTIFLLPAGLRPAKNVLFPLNPLAEIYSGEPSCWFILAGPIMDVEYASKAMTRLESYPFAHYLGGVGHDSIGCLYTRAAVVLNTSLFEGGMANSVLEAMAFGKPVLASDIEGNRSVVQDGVTGFIYRNEEEFRGKALLLMKDGELREKMGAQGRRLVQEQFRPEKEADEYIRLYESLNRKPC